MVDPNNKIPDQPEGFHDRRFTFGSYMKYQPDLTELTEKTYELPRCCIDPSLGESPIQNFLAGGHIFITGATGFMGKILMEKILASAPKVEKLYLLSREKKGVNHKERIEKLFDDPVFSRVRKTVPNYQEKVVIIKGDCENLRLGLSDEDYDMLCEKVTVIFHGAATVRFDEKLQKATKINIRAVRDIIRLAHKCKNLKSFLHISTAYSNSELNSRHIDEKYYPAAHDYEYLIKLAEEEDPVVVEAMTPKIIEGFPNTYALTKHIAEDLVRREAMDIPFAISRPAIVISTYEEPIRGWCDNIYGPVGIALGCGVGVIRTMLFDPKNRANMVPVDLCINSIIAAAWQAQKDFQEGKNGLIYNYVSATRNPLTWLEYTYWSAKYGFHLKYYSEKCIWYPVLVPATNRISFELLNFFLHTVPAYMADGVLTLMGKERMLIKGYAKIKKFISVICHFACNRFYFEDKNTEQLWHELTPLDQDIYPFDIKLLDWDRYMQTFLLGLRIHVAKDPLDTVPAAQRKMKWLVRGHRILRFVRWLLLAWVVWTLLKFFIGLF